METVLRARIETVRTQMFDATLSLARDIASQQQSGFSVEAFKDVLLDDLEVFPEQAREAMARLGELVEFNYDDKGPRETVINDRELLLAVQRVDSVLDTLVTYTEVADSMGLDSTKEMEFLVNTLTNSCANRSVFLDVAIAQVGLYRSSAATLPADEELPAWVAATEARVRVGSVSLQSGADLMDRIGLDTRQYRQQIVTATGAEFAAVTAMLKTVVDNVPPRPSSTVNVKLSTGENEPP